MNKEEMKTYELRLLNEKKSIEDTLFDMNRNGLNMSQREEVSELSTVDNHPGDMGTEMFDKERYFALQRNEKEALNRTVEALEAIKNGTYGKCELCGAEIGTQRLESMPTALWCLQCQELMPTRNTFKYDRPVEETLAPFSRYFMDDYVEAQSSGKALYNASGEDTWEEVDKFNDRPLITENYDDEEENEDDVVEFTDRISNQYYKEQLP